MNTRQPLMTVSPPGLTDRHTTWLNAWKKKIKHLKDGNTRTRIDTGANCRTWGLGVQASRRSGERLVAPNSTVRSRTRTYDYTVYI